MSLEITHSSGYAGPLFNAPFRMLSLLETSKPSEVKYLEPCKDEFRSEAWKTVWISDVHLGSRRCRAKELLNFLNCLNVSTVVLAGDFIDGWSLKSRWHWEPTYQAIFDRLKELAQKGTKILYVPGNHDEFLKPLIGSGLDQIQIISHYQHETPEGKRFLVVHGDQFDSLVNLGRFLHAVGDRCYGVMFDIDKLVRRYRNQGAKAHWTVAAFIKKKVKSAAKYKEKYEDIAANYAKLMGYDGIICGHVHHPQDRKIGGLRYINTGDWVEHCTALIEDRNGRLSLVNADGIHLVNELNNKNWEKEEIPA